MKKVVSPILTVSPMSIGCPFCDAEPGRDCVTTKRGFAVVHVQRVKEARRINQKRRRNREAKL
jgi:hypothetical protein